MGKYREGLTNYKEVTMYVTSYEHTYIINKNQNTLKLPQN